MTCVVLVKNPDNGCVVGIVSGLEDDEPNLAGWSTVAEAKKGVCDQLLVAAWGGYVVDLDNLEVY